MHSKIYRALFFSFALRILSQSYASTNGIRRDAYIARNDMCHTGGHRFLFKNKECRLRHNCTERGCNLQHLHFARVHIPAELFCDRKSGKYPSHKKNSIIPFIRDDAVFTVPRVLIDPKFISAIYLELPKLALFYPSFPHIAIYNEFFSPGRLLNCTFTSFYSASTGMNLNCVTSKSPISVTFTSGITGSDIKVSVITGSTSRLIPSSL